MFKKFMLKTMLGSQLKKLPPDMQDKVLTAIEKNPEAFTKMAEEIKAAMASGKDQMTAAMEVAKKHEAMLKEML